MQEMPNPHDGLLSFQEELRGDFLPQFLKPCSVYPELMLYYEPAEILGTNAPRFTYALIKDKTVHALVMATPNGYEGEILCIQVGYAVAVPFRNKGLAKKVLQQSIEEITHGLKNAGITRFYLEATIDEDNIASQKVASKVISSTPIKIEDMATGKPALRYELLIEC